MIRKATLNDSNQIYNLMCILEDTELDKKKFIHVYQENLFLANNKENKKISTYAVYYYVYETEHEIVGFMSLHIQQLLHHVSCVAEIQELIVKETVRGKGIGKALFEKAVELSKTHGCCQLEVSCNQKRTDSHKFYELQGMKNDHYKFSLQC